MEQVRVVLVDDCPAFLASAADYLSRDPRVSVVGTASNGRDGVRLARTRKPHLVLMDLAMPVMDGLTATRLIKSAAASTFVVIVSAIEPSALERYAENTVVDGCISKAQFTEGVTAVIDSMFDGPDSAAVFVADA